MLRVSFLEEVDNQLVISNESIKLTLYIRLVKVYRTDPMTIMYYSSRYSRVLKITESQAGPNSALSPVRMKEVIFVDGLEVF